MRKFLGTGTLVLMISTLMGQQQSPLPRAMDVQHYEIDAEVTPEKSLLEGTVTVRFKVLEDSASLPFELNSRISLLDAVDEMGVSYSQSYDDFESDRLRIRGPEPFSKGSELSLTLRFEGILEQEQYAFLETQGSGNAVIDGQGALLLSEEKWFPSHQLPLDTATAVVRIKVPLGFSVVGPGQLETIDTVGVSEVFSWKSDNPLTQIPVVVGRFFRQQYEAGPIPLTFYVTEGFEADLQPFADEVGKVLSFLESEYGPIPVSELNLVQVQAKQLLSTGCSGLMLLDDHVLEGHSLPIMALAQRVARQWWGYSLRPAGSPDAWLGDGFATYAALRYIETVYPDQLSTELARSAIATLKYESQDPVSRGFGLKQGTAQYNSIVSNKGAWILYMFAQLLGGDSLNALLADWYRNGSGQAVTTDEWVDFIQQKTEQDYGWFFVQWVQSVGVPEFRVEYQISKLREGTFRIRGQIRQEIELFRMPVDVRIVTKGQPEDKRLNINGKVTPFNFPTDTMPLRIELDPDGKILRDSKQMQVAVHVALGEEYQALGEFVTAIRELERAVQLDPRSSIANYRLGEVFFDQHNLSTASNSFREALNGDLKPDWVETWCHIYLGKLYDILGQRQRAMAEYQKAINTRNDHQGAQQEAQKYLKEAFSKPQAGIR